MMVEAGKGGCTMSLMSKKKRPTDGTPEGEGKKRYPSRENVRYIAVPLKYHEALERYAREHSNEDEKKSVSWAARVMLRLGLTGKGLWPLPPEEKEQP
jgi:hypothetical protein